ncbi:MAG: protein phosphatase 2C domain-containing protein [Gemmatimonadales bacterium]|nr:protein phosphatase 2C domain-containing protein [Gemmatimonadales bacterium]
MAAASHAGRRSSQEDAYLVRVHGGEAWLVVADGMGGHAAGEVASGLTIDAFGPAAQRGDPDPVVRLSAAASHANEAILAHARAHPESADLGSTVVAAVVRGGQVVLGHAGDSRAWLVTAEGVEQLTRDHSAVQDALDRGSETAAELARSPYRHAILRSLGDAAFPGLEWSPPGGALAVPPGSILLLTSDGAHGFLSPAEMLEHLAGTRALAEGLDHLLRRAYANGSDDNITLAACEVGRFPRSRVPAQPPPPIPRARPGRRRHSRALPVALGVLLLGLLAVLGVLLARVLAPRQQPLPAVTEPTSVPPTQAPVVVATPIAVATRAAHPATHLARPGTSAPTLPAPAVQAPVPTEAQPTAPPTVELPVPVNIAPAPTPPASPTAASTPVHGPRAGRTPRRGAHS